MEQLSLIEGSQTSSQFPFQVKKTNWLDVFQISRKPPTFQQKCWTLLKLTKNEFLKAQAVKPICETPKCEPFLQS